MMQSERPPPEQIVLYHKDPRTKIASITLNQEKFELGEECFGRGLNNSVMDYDKLCLPEWRLSYAGRKEAPPQGEWQQLRQQLAAWQEQMSALQAKING
jgi:hypothetical protein